MDFWDTAVCDATKARITRDGYLVADARIARTGIQVYRGFEMGRPDLKEVRVFRPEAEVFDNKTMASMAHRPVTIEHPTVPVTADNWKQYSVGMTGDEVTRDGEYVRVPLTLMDKGAIDDVKAGKRELSVGYACDIEWTAGTSPTGEAYDAVQRNISANHLAVVDAGRAGPECRIGDKSSISNREDNMKTMTIDGITVEMSDTAVQAVTKLQDRLTASTADVTRLQASLDTANATHKAAIDTKDGEIATLKKAIPDAATLDALAAERGALVVDAKAILGDAFDPAGKDSAAIKLAVVTHALGDATVKGKSVEYIAAAFDAIKATGVKQDPVRNVLQGNVRDTKPVDGRDKAYDSYCASLQDAWKGDTKAA